VRQVVGKLSRTLRTALLAASSASPGSTYEPGTLEKLGLVDDDAPEPVEEALDRWLEGDWLEGDIDKAARLMRRARRNAAKHNDAEELSELDVLVTNMRSNLTGDNLAYFDAVLAGRWLEELRWGRGQGLRDDDYVLCLIAVPLAAIPAAILLLVATGHRGAIGTGAFVGNLLLVTLVLSAGAGVWAGWRRSPDVGFAVAIGAFALSWMALVVALVLWYGLSGMG
jgi:hypothetical protein